MDIFLLYFIYICFTQYVYQKKTFSTCGLGTLFVTNQRKPAYMGKAHPETITLVSNAAIINYFGRREGKLDPLPF